MTGRVPESTARISVVGPCASGKSTLVKALRLHGYDARVIAQEHSSIANLWKRQDPDILIALKADLESVRLRRNNPKWRATVWSEQQSRLAHAFDHADLVADTSNRSVNEVVADVLGFLARQETEKSDAQ